MHWPMTLESADTTTSMQIVLWMAIVHYSDVIMGAIASQITSFTIVYSTVYSDADQRKHQSSASLAFVRGIHRGPVNSQHKWPVTRKMFPFDNVIMPNCKPSRYPTCKLVCPQSKTAKLKIRPIVSYHAFQFFLIKTARTITALLFLMFSLNISVDSC